MTGLFAMLAAAWLTGMVPLAAGDVCGAFDTLNRRERLVIYWGWPVLLFLFIYAADLAARFKDLRA